MVAVRLAALLITTSACGRLGFEPVSADAEGLSLDATVFPDGVAAGACGSTELMRDDFDVAGAPPLFMQFTASGLTISESGSLWNLTFAANVSAGRYAGYKSVLSFPVDGLCASIESVAVPNPSGALYFKLIGGDEQIEFFLIDNLLSMRTRKGAKLATLAVNTFDPAKHRFWRLRNQGGMTFWDTSPNNVDFFVLVSTSFLTTRQLFFEHGGGTMSSVQGGGTGSFDQALVTGP
jgi:hypothetical protein